MGQEFFINSQELQNKVSKLLPSQGGAGAGFDLSASTQIIPIIDLTESAEGSNFRQDLQTSLSLDSQNVFSVTGATTTVITNTGYWRVIGVSTIATGTSSTRSAFVQITDGITAKNVWEHKVIASPAPAIFTTTQVDIVVFLKAGDSLAIGNDTSSAFFTGSIRQIATVDGELVNPT